MEGFHTVWQFETSQVVQFGNGLEIPEDSWKLTLAWAQCFLLGWDVAFAGLRVWVSSSASRWRAADDVTADLGL